jgi:hypothetical protein
MDTHGKMRQRALRVMVLAWVLLNGPAVIHAAPTFTVNSPADVAASQPLDNGVCETAPGNGVCTLRAAIMKANHLPIGQAMIVLPPGTFTLGIPSRGEGDETTGDLDISATVSIVGAGPGVTIIDGNGAVTQDRVFAIRFGGEVSISGVTMRGGTGKPLAFGGQGGFGGGAIVNLGVLTLNNSEVSGNTVAITGLCGGCGGGGIANASTLTLTNSIVRDNGVTVAGGITCSACGGGGIYSSSRVTVTNSTVSGNNVAIAGSVCGDCGGAGVYVDLNGIAVMTGSTLSDNSLAISNPGICSQCGGGGIRNTATLTMVNSTVSGNRVSTDGGGIFNSGVASVVAVTNILSSTIANNRANTSGGSGIGGGVLNRAGNTFTLQNAIVAANDLVFIFDDCAGTLFAVGVNLLRSIDETRCTVAGTAPIVALPQLGPLQNNGGPTETHALLAGSPAIDAGNPACRDNLGALLTSDQRGFPRGANGDPCDIGAFEVQPDVGLVAAVLPSSRSVQVNATATALGTVINTGQLSATACRITPLTSIPAVFHFQATDSRQHGGPIDKPVDIPPGAPQDFVFSFTPTQAFEPTDVQLTFDCADSNPAAVTTGLNTLLLSASVTAVPDIVALAATMANDGIVNIPGANGTGAFAVATANVGSSGGITASADTGAATLPVAVSLCQTDPGTGACLAAPSSTVSATIDAGATPTFGVFVTGGGTVPFDPAQNRVFVRFKDAGAVIRGATSVAVRTQ